MHESLQKRHGSDRRGKGKHQWQDIRAGDERYKISSLSRVGVRAISVKLGRFSEIVRSVQLAAREYITLQQKVSVSDANSFAEQSIS